MGPRDADDRSTVAVGAAVSNASPLISLQQISHLHLLHELFEVVYVPPAVVSETKRSVVLPSWIEVRVPSADATRRLPPRALGPGESEVLALALDLQDVTLILDDLPARRIAAALGLQLVGTLGTLVLAKRRGLVPVVRTLIHQLAAHGLHATPELVARVLASVGESPEWGR